MKLSDEVIIPVPRQKVWEALNDPGFEVPADLRIDDAVRREQGDG